MEKWSRNGRAEARGMQKTDTNCCTYENSFVCRRDCCLLHLFCMLIGGQSKKCKVVKKGFVSFRVSFVMLLNVYGSGQLFCQIPFALAG